MARPHPLDKLGARERQIMEILFRLGQATASEVEQQLGGTVTNSGVRGMLRLLVGKGLVAYKADGNRYVYRPLQRPDHAGRKALSHLVGTFFKGSSSSAIATLLDMESDSLSDEEYHRLSTLLAKARNGRKN